MTPTWGKGQSKMTRGKPVPVVEKPRIDAEPCPFPDVPLPDARIVPARCGRCGGYHHYAMPAEVAWVEYRAEAACRDCGAVGTLQMERGRVG